VLWTDTVAQNKGSIPLLALNNFLNYLNLDEKDVKDYTGF
jgi:hypothetical protein